MLVIFCWVFLLAAGFALIYWSSLPAGFRLNTGTNPQQQSGFLSAIYFSLEALTTLGLGDLTPKPGWLRILVTFEALVGFSLVTASVSWVLLIYPALARTVTFATCFRSRLCGEGVRRRSHIEQRGVSSRRTDARSNSRARRLSSFQSFITSIPMIAALHFGPFIPHSIRAVRRTGFTPRVRQESSARRHRPSSRSRQMAEAFASPLRQNRERQSSRNFRSVRRRSTPS